MNVGLRVSAVWKINQKFFFYCGSHWKTTLFWVCFSLKFVVKSVRISLFNLTVVWHLVNCPNSWINNLRLRIFYKPTLWFCFTLMYGLLDMGIVTSLIVNAIIDIWSFSCISAKAVHTPQKRRNARPSSLTSFWWAGKLTNASSERGTSCVLLPSSGQAWPERRNETHVESSGVFVTVGLNWTLNHG